jgi:antitoxin MazE
MNPARAHVKVARPPRQLPFVSVRTDVAHCTYGGDAMRKKLTKTGNSLALVLDKRLLDQLGIDAKTSLEVSTNGDVLVVSPVRNKRRSTALKRIVAEAHAKYEGVFRRLAE